MTQPHFGELMEYLRSSGQNCIVCKSEQLNWDSIEIEGDTANQDVFCNDCGSEWTDQYKIIGVHNLKRGETHDTD